MFLISNFSSNIIDRLAHPLNLSCFPYFHQSLKTMLEIKSRKFIRNRLHFRFLFYFCNSSSTVAIEYWNWILHLRNMNKKANKNAVTTQSTRTAVTIEPIFHTFYEVIEILLTEFDSVHAHFM